jgi:hypothetical protein
VKEEKNAAAGLVADGVGLVRGVSFSEEESGAA